MTKFNMFVYNLLKHFIDQQVIDRMFITGHGIINQDLVDNYHPSQLEKRFGGQAETPTVFWPPTMGTKDLLVGDEPDYFMTDEEYK